MNLAAILLQVAFIAVATGDSRTLAWDYPELGAGIVDQFNVYVKYVPVWGAGDPMPVVDPASDGLLGVVGAADALSIVADFPQPGAYFFAATAVDNDSGVESGISNVVPLFAIGPPINLRPLSGPIGISSRIRLAPWATTPPSLRSSSASP